MEGYSIKGIKKITNVLFVIMLIKMACATFMTRMPFAINMFRITIAGLTTMNQIHKLILRFQCCS